MNAGAGTEGQEPARGVAPNDELPWSQVFSKNWDWERLRSLFDILDGRSRIAVEPSLQLHRSVSDLLKNVAHVAGIWVGLSVDALKWVGEEFDHHSRVIFVQASQHISQQQGDGVGQRFEARVLDPLFLHFSCSVVGCSLAMEARVGGGGVRSAPADGGADQ